MVFQVIEEGRWDGLHTRQSSQLALVIHCPLQICRLHKGGKVCTVNVQATKYMLLKLCFVVSSIGKGLVLLRGTEKSNSTVK